MWPTSEINEAMSGFLCLPLYPFPSSSGIRKIVPIPVFAIVGYKN